MLALKAYLDNKGVKFQLNTTVTGFEKANKIQEGIISQLKERIDDLENQIIESNLRD